MFEFIQAHGQEICTGLVVLAVLSLMATVVIVSVCGLSSQISREEEVNGNAREHNNPDIRVDE